MYAHQSYDYMAAHESPDWEIAFAHAVLGHAAFAGGETALHRRRCAKAQEPGRAIADLEDRQIFFKTFDLPHALTDPPRFSPHR